MVFESKEWFNAEHAEILFELNEFDRIPNLTVFEIEVLLESGKTFIIQTEPIKLTIKGTVDPEKTAEPVKTN